MVSVGVSRADNCLGEQFAGCTSGRQSSGPAVSAKKALGGRETTVCTLD